MTSQVKTNAKFFILHPLRAELQAHSLHTVIHIVHLFQFEKCNASKNNLIRIYSALNNKVIRHVL